MVRSKWSCKTCGVEFEERAKRQSPAERASSGGYCRHTRGRRGCESKRGADVGAEEIRFWSRDLIFSCDVGVLPWGSGKYADYISCHNTETLTMEAAAFWVGFVASIGTVLQLSGEVIKYVEDTTTALAERQNLIGEIIATNEVLRSFEDRAKRQDC